MAKREGSRLLLALALAGCVAAAFAAGWAAGWLLDALGVRSSAVRLGVKAVALAASLPAAFYAVERIFLVRTSRRGDRDGKRQG